MDPNKQIILHLLLLPDQPNPNQRNPRKSPSRSIYRLTQVVPTMADDELVVPEADERSRWLVRHPVGCAVVVLDCIYCQFRADDPPLTLLILVLGVLAVFLYDLAMEYADR